MLEFIGLSFTFVGFLLILFVTLKFRPNPVFALHAIVFWTFVVAFNTVSTWVNDASYEADIYLLVHLLLFTYLSIYLVLVRVFSNPSDSDRLFFSIRAISTKTLVVCMSLWLFFRIYLLLKYGVASFQLLAVRQDVDASYLEASLNTLLLYLALGAFFAFVVRAGSDLRSVLNPMTALLSASVFVFVCLFSELLSSRRFMLSILILLGLVLIYRQKESVPRPRILLVVGLLGLMTVGMAEFYQQIRFNLYEAEFIALVSQSDLLSIGQAILLYFTTAPTVQHTIVPVDSFATLENLQERFSPFQVLYVITARQVSELTVTGGALVAQSFHNVIPAIFLSEKENINADHIIAEVFDLEDTDLPTGILVSLQSELAWLAFLVTPVLMFLLIWMYKRLLVVTRSRTLQLVCLGLSVLTASYIEALLDAVLVNLRDLLVLIVILTLVRAIGVLLKPTPQYPYCTTATEGHAS